MHRATTDAPNAKVGVLAELARAGAAIRLLLVNDSDIVVRAGISAGGDRAAGRSADRAGDVPLSGAGGIAGRRAAKRWGSPPNSRRACWWRGCWAWPNSRSARTMVFRAEDLRRIGGFAAIADYLADDYQLGRHISELGYRIEFAPVVVETDLGGGVLGADLAAPIALVAHHSRLAAGGLLRLRGDARHAVGAGGVRGGAVVGGRGGAGAADDGGSAGGRGHPEGSECGRGISG